MTTTQKSTPELLTRGQSLAQNLRAEGRAEDAKTVVALIDALKPAPQPEYLTTGKVAERIGVSRQTIVNWVKKGWLKGVRLRGRIMIPSTELAEFDDLLTVFDALDAERSPPTVEEINEALAPGRKDWTWRGKEK